MRMRSIRNKAEWEWESFAIGLDENEKHSQLEIDAELHTYMHPLLHVLLHVLLNAPLHIYLHAFIYLNLFY